MITYPQLTLMLPKGSVVGFSSLLQHGILVAVDKPVGLVQFLSALPGADREYLETVVQTIFLNGVAVDDLDICVASGSVLALSGAMPGLAGAIFRRRGIHGVLRSKAEPADRPEDSKGHGFVTLKLFNRIATDLVAGLLSSGIFIAGPALHEFAGRQEHLFRPPVSLFWQGRAVTDVLLLQLLIDYDVVAMRASYTE